MIQILRCDRNLGVFAFVALVWVPVTLCLDRGASRYHQLVLGVIAWLCLLWLLRRESSLTRAQVAIVVAYATVIEYTFSEWLGAYEYRLHHIPSFVPPGHGLIYLAALALGRSDWMRCHGRHAVWAILMVGGIYAAWAYFASSRPDGVGAFWYGCLAAFIVRGRSPLVYTAAFVIVTYLELLGTALGTWTWAARDPILHTFRLGNPPSGIAGAYCFLDAAGLALAPRLLDQLIRLQRGKRCTKAATYEPSSRRSLLKSAERTGSLHEAVVP